MQIRVGLNSGEVVVRAIGSDLRMDYTAVGQTTHLAARMEQLASPGTTLLTADTLRLAEGYVAGSSRVGAGPGQGARRARSRSTRLLGAGPLRSRLHAAAARGPHPLRRARDASWSSSARRSAAPPRGHGQVVALVGEPGVGKSRLVWEVTHSHRTHGWLIVQASSVSYGKATPYLPVIDLLKGYLRIQDQDDPRAVREKVTGKLLTLDEALKPTVPAFLALLDVPVDDAAWSALDPPQRRQRTLEAVKRLLLRESQVQPLLVVFEDLHWIDGETQAAPGQSGREPADGPDAPPRELPPRVRSTAGAARRTTRSSGSTPCRPRAPRRCWMRSLGTDPALRPLKHLLIERTEGNPFFLEESVRTLVETEVLAGERGAYRLAQALPSIQVPATVQAVLAARIDRLAAEDKRLLQAAAVIGKDVPFAVLQAIAEVPEDDLRHGLATPPGGRVPLRGAPLSRPRVHLQARPDPRGGVRQPAPGPAARPPRPDRRGHRAALPRPAGRAHRATGPPRGAGRSCGTRRSPTSDRPAPRPSRRSANREALAYFEQALTALDPPPRDPRDAGAGHRSPLRPSERALPAGRIREDRGVSPRSRSPGQDARRSAAARMGIGLYVQPSPAHWRSRNRRATRSPGESRPSARRSAMMPLQVAAQYYLLLACHLVGRLSQGPKTSVGD